MCVCVLFCVVVSVLALLDIKVLDVVDVHCCKVLHKGIYTCWFNEDKKKVVIVKGEGECIEI